MMNMKLLKLPLNAQKNVIHQLNLISAHEFVEDKYMAVAVCSKYSRVDTEAYRLQLR